MIFDSHAHYDSSQFDVDRDELITEISENGIGTIVNVGAAWAALPITLELAEKYPFIYAALGLHPNDVEDLDEEKMEQLKQMCQQDRVVAVGEIGLDYYWDNVPCDVQKKWFIRQLDLAQELDLPVIIHSRDAAEDTLNIMKRYEGKLRGVIHCFSYSKEMAREYVKMGFYIGIGGVVTFKNGKKIKAVVSEIPLDRILLETDCPYLAPEPYRGKRNSSLYLPEIAQTIADIKGITYEEVVDKTRENAKTLFQISE